ncbi:uncharacterized protein LOC111284735 [Durio zibethinus]|uniref:Uncharacterized protein LOC111284735 n=1 Tax=Durio zibethinus TaxID=66656 RepID=A0A6P5XN74_DURZI|nr:uncharacterized protein LOC111284735 [Durio zibethinus]
MRTWQCANQEGLVQSVKLCPHSKRFLGLSTYDLSLVLFKIQVHPRDEQGRSLFGLPDRSERKVRSSFHITSGSKKPKTIGVGKRCCQVGIRHYYKTQFSFM